MARAEADVGVRSSIPSKVRHRYQAHRPNHRSASTDGRRSSQSAPRDAVDEVVAAAGKGARRSDGKLAPHVMVYFAMALALFAETVVRLHPDLCQP